MKYQMIIFILLCCNKANTIEQSKNKASINKTNYSLLSDSLNKYSYQITGYCNYNGMLKITFGTGFFIKRNGKSFLVSAGHVFKGCNNLEKFPCQADFLTVYAVQGGITSKKNM